MLKRLLLAAAVLAATTVSARAQVPVCSAFGQSCVSPDTTCSAAVESPTTTICLATVASSTSTTPSSLLTGLIHYWTLDETSGTRADSVGSATLNDNNTVGSDTGKDSNAANFVATSSESLTTSKAAHMAQGSAWAVSLWYYPVTSAQSGIISITDQTVSGRILVDLPGAGGAVRLYDAASNALSGLSVTNGNWYHIVAQFDPTDGTFGRYKLWVNNTAAGTGTGLKTAGMFTGDVQIRLGVYWDASRFLTGRIDEVGVWQRLLLDDERATLYNSGAGKFYPSF